MNPIRSTFIAGLCITALACGPSVPKDDTTPDGLGGHTAVTDTPDAPAAAPAELVFPNEPFRAKQPGPGTPRPFQLPKLKQFKLGNQMDVYLVERHELPTISMRLQFEGGSINDRRGKEGTASVCMSLMSDSTKKLNKTAFSEALADIASSVSSSAGQETQTVSMSTLTNQFDRTFELFSDVLTQPGYYPADLDRYIKRSLETLKQSKASAGSVAGRVRGSLLYGQRHPFGTIRTEKSLGAIKLPDCTRYHRSYIKPKGAKLFVVGDMTEAQVKEHFGKLLTKWRGKPKRSARLPKPKRRSGKLFFVNVKDAPQSSIYVMHMGPKRNDPAYFANTMMSTVLGGGFASRINMNLREDKGYSYGARGTFGYSRSYGTFTASSSVRANATRQSVVEIINEMTSLKSRRVPATQAELDREREGSILSLPARFATASQALGAYSSLIYHSLPLDYYDHYIANMGKVTLEQVNGAAAKLLDPESAIILVVGDANAEQLVHDGGKDAPLKGADGNPVKLLDALKTLAKSGELGKGPLVVLDTDGNVQKTYK